MLLKAIPAMLSMIPSVLSGVRIEDLERIKRVVRATFPDVKQIKPDTLTDWLAKSQSILVVDVRSPEEFAVSHLPNAINLSKAQQIRHVISERNPRKTVLYCSVGFRSSQIAARLSNIEEVFNLEGSIFEWANEGRPVFNGEVKMARVHPFGKRWAGLLKKGLAHELP